MSKLYCLQRKISIEETETSEKLLLTRMSKSGLM